MIHFQEIECVVSPDLTKLQQELFEEEGYRSLLYDDKTGKLLKSGDTIVGNPTIAIGWNVAGKPINKERSFIILGWFIQDAYDDLVKALPWVTEHNEAIQLALTDLSFNLGIDKLLTFKNTLSLIQQHKYGEAANNLDKSLWAKQVGPKRSKNIEDLINKDV